MLNETGRLIGDFTNAVATELGDGFILAGPTPATQDEAYSTCQSIDWQNLSYQGYSNNGAPWLSGAAGAALGLAERKRIVREPQDRAA